VIRIEKRGATKDGSYGKEKRKVIWEKKKRLQNSYCEAQCIRPEDVKKTLKFQKGKKRDSEQEMPS